MFTSLATDIDDPVERLLRHPREDDRRQGGARGRRRQHAAELGRVRRPELVQPGVAACTRAGSWPTRHRPIHNVIISNVPGPAVPALLRRRRDGGGVPDRSDHGGRRAEHHRVQLPRLHRHRVHGRAASWSPTCGTWSTRSTTSFAELLAAARAKQAADQPPRRAQRRSEAASTKAQREPTPAERRPPRPGRRSGRRGSAPRRAKPATEVERRDERRRLTCKTRTRSGFRARTSAMAFNIADLFERAVDTVPDRMAMAVGDVHLTFRELDDAANRFANHLRSEGIGSGDHIGIYGQNSAEWIIAALGAYKVSAVPININFRYVEDELVYIFDNADLVAPGARPAVHAAHRRREGQGTGAAPLRRDRGRQRRGPRPARVGADGRGAGRRRAPSDPTLERSPDDRYMLYTGGTTGMPKGVVWRQEDVFFALGGGIDAYTNERVTHDGQLAEKAAASPTGDGVAQHARRSCTAPPSGVPCGSGSRAARSSSSRSSRARRCGTRSSASRSTPSRSPATPWLGRWSRRCDAEPDRWDLSSLLVVSSTRRRAVARR